MKKIFLLLTALLLSTNAAFASTCPCMDKTAKEENCSAVKEFFEKCDYQIEQKKILEELNLSKEQYNQVKVLYKQKDATTKPLEKQLKKEIKIEEKLLISQATKEQIAQQQDKMVSLKNEINAADKKFTKGFHKILTPNQKIKLYEIKIKKIMDGSLDLFLNECGCGVDCNCKEDCDCGCNEKNSGSSTTIDLNSVINTIFTPQQQQQIKDQSKQIQEHVQQQIQEHSQDLNKEVQKGIDTLQKTLDCNCKQPAK